MLAYILIYVVYYINHREHNTFTKISITITQYFRQKLFFTYHSYKMIRCIAISRTSMILKIFLHFVFVVKIFLPWTLCFQTESHLF